MTRIDLIVTILCIHQYIIQATPTSSATDEAPQNPFETYDSTQTSDEFDAIKQQPLTAYQDFFLTNEKEFYLPHTLVTMSASRAPHKEEKSSVAGDPVNSDANDEHQTSTASIVTDDNHLTTALQDDSRTNDLVNDLIITKDIEDMMDNTSQPNSDFESMPLEHIETAAANKHLKMFIPVDEYDTADVQILPVHIENAIQSSSEQLVARNDTDEEEENSSSSSSIDDNVSEEMYASETTEEQSTTMPTTTTQNIYKKAKSIPTTITTTMSTTSSTTKRYTTMPTTTISHIYKFSADEILRKFLEDSYIRSPLAVLIDTSPNSLRKSKRLWKAALRPNSAVDIVLVAYNATGKI